MVRLSVLFDFLVITGAFGSMREVHWLPCRLVEDLSQVDVTGHTEIIHHHKEAILQFGEPGDSLVAPDALTFLILASKVDMRQYLEGEVDQFQCEIRRYSTAGIQVRWPGPGAQELDTWFTCTLRHGEGVLVITTFLRHIPTTPPDAQEDYNKRSPLGDREIVHTIPAMVVLTRSPSVMAGLLRDPNLHCQFAVDHRRPDMTVEWQLQRRGERSKLFSYSSRSGKTKGGGVSPKAIVNGDASLQLLPTTVTSEGTYICSVYVPPLLGSHDIIVSIMESPRVSLSVGSALSLQEGEEHKVVCDAQGYYPLDVQIEWLREQVDDHRRVPEVLKNVLHSSHRHHQDGTYSVSAYFLLHPTLQHSGYTYTCRVSHISLQTPVRKSFQLKVVESVSWSSALFVILAIGFLVIMSILLVAMLRFLHSAKKEAHKDKPY